MGTGLGLKGPKLTVALITGLAVVLIVGGVAAIVVGRRVAGAAESRIATVSGAGITRASLSAQSTGRSAAGSSTAGLVEPGPVTPDSTRYSTDARPDPSSSPEAVSSAGPTSTASTTTSALGPSSNLTVQLAPGVSADAHSDAVVAAFQQYFDAINQHDYAAWSQSVSGELAAQSSGQWLAAYSSTTDSTIWIESIREHPIQVRLRFTSEQEVTLAPDDLQSPCINWDLTYTLLPVNNGRMVIGSTVPGSVHKSACQVP